MAPVSRRVTANVQVVASAALQGWALLLSDLVCCLSPSLRCFFFFFLRRLKWWLYSSCYLEKVMC